MAEPGVAAVPHGEAALGLPGCPDEGQQEVLLGQQLPEQRGDFSTLACTWGGRKPAQT